MSEPITEIVVFRSKPGHSARVRELAHHAVDEARKHGGVVDDALYQSHDDENLFVHHVRWASLDDACRVAELFPQFPCAAEFMELTAEQILMSHFHPATP